jgi:hypothetical protein
MKRILAAIAIACFLSSAAFAGDIPSVPGPQPPPSGSTAPGEIPSVPFAEGVSSEALTTLLSALTFLTV